MSQSMDKSMILIDLVADGYDTLPALATAAGFPKSTTHRLVRVLEERGWLRRQSNYIFLGFRLLELAGQLRDELKLPELARPLMERVAVETQESVHLARLDGAHIVYLEKVNGRRGFEMASRVGMTLPSHRTALGKVLISHLAESAWASTLKLSAGIGERYMVPGVERQLPIVQRYNLAIDDEENETGVRCLAVPIWQADGATSHAVSVSGPTFFVTWDRLSTILVSLRALSCELSQQLGGSRFAEAGFAIDADEAVAQLRSVYQLNASPTGIQNS